MENVTFNSQNLPIAGASMDVPRTGEQVVLGNQIFTDAAVRYFVSERRASCSVACASDFGRPLQTIITISLQNHEWEVERGMKPRLGRDLKSVSTDRLCMSTEVRNERRKG